MGGVHWGLAHLYMIAYIPVQHGVIVLKTITYTEFRKRTSDMCVKVERGGRLIMLHCNHMFDNET